MHRKGSRHIAAESRLREKELATQAELNKRIALSSDSNVLASIGSSTTHAKCNGNQDKPLIEQTRGSILEAQSSKFNDLNARNDRSNSRTRRYISTNDLKLHNSCNSVEEQSVHTGLDESNSSDRELFAGTEAHSKMLVDWNAQLQKRQEKELKLTTAGWKRDCHGKWYRDENVSCSFGLFGKIFSRVKLSTTNEKFIGHRFC